MKEIKKEIKIKIGENLYTIKQSFKGLLIFEEITNKKAAEANDSVTDLLIMFYSLIKASNKDFEYTFDQFIDIIDENQDSIEAFTEFLNELSKEQPSTSNSENKSKKKKV